jgi:hypothetical protein
MVYQSQMRKLLFLITAGLLAAPSTTIKNEQPGGLPDGARQFFTLKHKPVKWTVQLYRNGLRQFIGVDFAEDPPAARVGFFPCCLPQPGDILLADYEYAP